MTFCFYLSISNINCSVFGCNKYVCSRKRQFFSKLTFLDKGLTTNEVTDDKAKCIIFRLENKSNIYLTLSQWFPFLFAMPQLITFKSWLSPMW